MIVLDSREPNNIKKLFVEMNVEHKIETLPVGDFVCGSAVVERKTMDDFVASIIDKRIYRQIENMCANYKKSLILISGSFKQQFNLRGKKISKKFPLHYMMKLSANYNIPIIRVDTDRELIYCTIKFLELCNNGDADDELFVKRRGKTETERRIIGLAEILDLGIATVRKMYEVNAIDAVIVSDIKKISKIKGIGPKTIRRIENAGKYN